MRSLASPGSAYRPASRIFTKSVAAPVAPRDVRAGREEGAGQGPGQELPGLAVAANIGKNGDFLRDPDHLEALVVWCAVAERWSQLRQVLQASPVEKWLANLGAICALYGFWDDDGAEADEQTKAVMLAEAAAVTSGLPGPVRQPNLGEFVNELMMPYGGMAIFRQIDDILISFGL